MSPWIKYLLAGAAFTFPEWFLIRLVVERIRKARQAFYGRLDRIDDKLECIVENNCQQVIISTMLHQSIVPTMAQIRKTYEQADRINQQFAKEMGIHSQVAKPKKKEPEMPDWVSEFDCVIEPVPVEDLEKLFQLKDPRHEQGKSS
jgi:hypothetical protein